MAARVYPHIPALLTAGRGSSVSTARKPELDKAEAKGWTDVRDVLV